MTGNNMNYVDFLREAKTIKNQFYNDMNDTHKDFRPSEKELGMELFLTWHDKLTQKYINALDRIASCPEEPTEEDVKKLYNAIWILFDHIENVKTGGYSFANKIDRMILSKDYKEHDAIKSIGNFGKRCKQLISKLDFDEYKRSHGVKDDQDSIENEKIKLRNQINYEENSSDAWFLATVIVGVCAIVLPPVGLFLIGTIYKTNKHGDKKVMLTKQLNTFDDISSSKADIDLNAIREITKTYKEELNREIQKNFPRSNPKFKPG